MEYVFCLVGYVIIVGFFSVVGSVRRREVVGD